jgi:hypothetical protein
MPTWEFLLQKKGDESWLPLESPTLEILEGEYRIAAKSSLRNINTVIDIDYVPSDRQFEQSPYQQSVSRAISDKGLLLVAPFLNLKAGTWQFNCKILNCEVEGLESKSLTIEVLEAIASYDLPNDLENDWQNDGLENDWQNNLGWNVYEPTSPLDFLSFIDVSAESISKSANPLPLELITLHCQEFKIKGGEALEIMGEAYISGAIVIKLQNAHGDTIESEYIHDNTDSDFFNHIITIPEQAEAQIFQGEIRIYPHQLPDSQAYITTQSLTVICAAVITFSSRFPLLPFEHIPNQIPMRRNIKFPELPEFLTLIKPQFTVKTSSKPTRPMPNWNISQAHKIPGFSNHAGSPK